MEPWRLVFDTFYHLYKKYSLHGVVDSTRMLYSFQYLFPWWDQHCLLLQYICLQSWTGYLMHWKTALPYWIILSTFNIFFFFLCCSSITLNWKQLWASRPLLPIKRYLTCIIWTFQAGHPWSSVLTRTGVFRGKDNDPQFPADAVYLITKIFCSTLWHTWQMFWVLN